MSSGIPFRKMNGLGNEIVVVDLRGSRTYSTPAQARAIAARPSSHFDQMMVLHDPKIRRHRGLRAHLQYRRLGGRGLRQRHALRRLGGGAADRAQGAEVRDRGRRARRRRGRHRPHHRRHGHARGSAGRTSRSPSRSTTRAPSSCRSGRSTSRSCIRRRSSTSAIPHAVFWVEDVAAYDLGRIGPMLENHPIFPERANISLAHVTSRDAITLRTWERGAGLTKACGSAACAAAVCAARKGLTGRAGDGDAAGRSARHRVARRRPTSS